MNPLKKILVPAIGIIILAMIGVAGYKHLQGWSLLESVYMVVITLTAVGLRDINHMTPAGRIFDMAMIISGVGIAVYIFGQLVEMIVEGQIMGYRRRKKMEQRITEMKNHYIICGFGRVGHQVAEGFALERIPYVVLDDKPETAEELAEKKVPFFAGDITSDKLLLDAGIKRAKGLIAAADSDTANVFVTLSARVINPKLIIIARASSMDAEEKMKKAGANRVISPYYIAGSRMSALAIKPIAVDFLDIIQHNEDMEMREILISEKSTLVGETLGDANIRQKYGVFITAVRKENGDFNYQPIADTRIDRGDILVAIGAPRQIDQLSRGIAK